MTIIKKLILVALFLLSRFACAQGVRYDIPPILGPTGQPLPNIAVALCSGTGTISGATCSPQTQSFSDITLGVPCALGSPVTLTASTQCQNTSDAFGNAGFWLTPGAYIYCLTGRGIAGACFNLTMPAGSTPLGTLRSGSITTTGLVGFTAGGPTGASDTGLSRTTAGTVAVGNGTQGDASGGLQAAAAVFNNSGSAGAGSSSAVVIKAPSFPTLGFSITGGGTDDKNWDIDPQSNRFDIRAVNDANNNITVPLTLFRGSGFTTTGVQIGSGNNLIFSAGTSLGDTGLSRTTAGTVAVGNGTQGDASGTLKTNNVLAGDGTLSAPSYSFSNAPSVGFFHAGTGNIEFGSGGVGYINLGTSLTLRGSAAGLLWSNGDPFSIGPDTGLTRSSAGVVAVGQSGTVGDATGSLNLQNLTSPTLGTANSTPTNFGSGTITFGSSVWNGSSAISVPATLIYAPAQVTNPNMFFALNFPSTLPAGGFVQLQTIKAATSGANVQSPILQLIGDSWNGTSSQQDYWMVQDVLGSGANPLNTLTFTHGGGSGPSAVQVSNSVLQVGQADTGMSRTAAGTVAVGNGTQGDKSGTIAAAKLTDDGSGNFYLIQNSTQALNTYNGGVLAWSSTGAANGSKDTGLSRSAAGTVAVGNGTPGDKSGTIAAAKLTDDGSGNFYLIQNSTQALNTYNGGVLAWSSTGLANGSKDTGLSRTAAGTVAVGNGTASDASGTLKATTVNAVSGFQVNGTALGASNLSNGVTGSGSVVLANSPSLTTPNVGAASGNTLTFTNQAAPANPPAGSITLYGDSGTGQVTCRNSSGGSCFSATAAAPFISSSANPAASGVLRAASGDTAVAFRNNANSGDIAALTKDTSDVVQVGGSAGMKSSTFQATSNSGLPASCGGAAFFVNDVTSPNSADICFGDGTGWFFNLTKRTGATSTSVFSVKDTGVVNATAGYQIAGAAASGNVLRGNGTNFVSAQLAAGDLSNGITGSGSVVLQNNPVLGHPQINTGIVNSGSGVMHVRVASCTTTATNFGACTSTVTWPAAFADTNYTAVCSMDQTGAAGALTAFAISSKTTSQVLVVVQNANSNANASAGTLNCIAMHD